jgi:hypothetical protein
MELLGCGLIHPEIMRQCGLEKQVRLFVFLVLFGFADLLCVQVGWAFGMGLERLSMVLYRINDIRAFWSRDDRFAKQFRGLALEAPIVYSEYSKFPKVSFFFPVLVLFCFSLVCEHKNRRVATFLFGLTRATSRFITISFSSWCARFAGIWWNVWRTWTRFNIRERAAPATHFASTIAQWRRRSIARR